MRLSCSASMAAASVWPKRCAWVSTGRRSTPCATLVSSNLSPEACTASFHELTTQVPHEIDVALERGKTKPRLDSPPTRFFWFSGPAFHEGIETHVLEALRLWHERRRTKLDVLLKYARMRHVERAMRPYLEVMQ